MFRGKGGKGLGKPSYALSKKRQREDESDSSDEEPTIKKQKTLEGTTETKQECVGCGAKGENKCCFCKKYYCDDCSIKCECKKETHTNCDHLREKVACMDCGHDWCIKTLRFVEDEGYICKVCDDVTSDEDE